MRIWKQLAVTTIVLISLGCAAEYRTLHEKQGAGDTIGSSDQTGKKDKPSIINDNPDDFVITADPLIVFEGDEVTFTGECGDGEGKVIHWDFGDGNEGAGELIKHPFAKAGSYAVVATCKEDGVPPKTETVTITVQKLKTDFDTNGPGDDSDGADDADGSDDSDGSDDNGGSGGSDGSDDTDGSDDSGGSGDNGDSGDSDGSDDNGGSDGSGESDDSDGSDDNGGATDDDDDPPGPPGPGGKKPGQHPSQTPGQTPWQTPWQTK